MNSGPRRPRRAKITVDAIVEITDESAVIAAALADLQDGEFTNAGEGEAHRRDHR